MSFVVARDKPFENRHRTTVRMARKLQLDVRFFGTNFLRMRTMVKQYTKRPLRCISESILRDRRNTRKFKESRIVKPTKRNRVITPSYDAFLVMAMFRENPNVQPEKSVVPRVPLPIPLVVANAPPDAVARTKMGKRLHIAYPLAYKSINEVARNRDQVGVECIDALYDALEARTARRGRAMKITKVDNAVAVERPREVVVLYFDAIHVGSLHSLVYSPSGKRDGANGERGKCAARHKHRNAYLQKPKQIAHDVIRKRRRSEHHGGGV